MKPKYTNWDSVPVTFGIGIAALLLGCCEKSVCNLVKAGKLKATTACKPWVIQKADLMAFLNANQN